MGIAKKAALKSIEFYKKHISPLKPPSCRFTPTCSTYMYKSIEHFGLFRGLLLGTWRILRCNPFNPGGEDPVPEEFPISLSFPRRKKNEKVRY
ncbi:membrane protein insertion efficiency factor YidD [Kosmotoga pacifica]|uniref:Putative membrane protein insertion efficiency factor n=1 Tax=Kosmotoga pacifica TaxID=1330330 RepID=A0A0G2Z916_9BACT|nr:membrane protein insertion efficiency factor YidD [Kosmotoga pacifica]AKI98052.1 membrane protein insertion efficiency factor [Kosmotoga pacifica]